MKTANRLILTTSPLSQPARNPRRTASLTCRRRPLYGRKRHHSTGKERDTETGLYYYGARYLDGRTGRWLSGDPAVGGYVPSAPVDDGARRRNKNLPGQGGVFNYVNLHLYHYAGNNPVKYTDPDGRTGSFPDGSPEQDILWMKNHSYSDKDIANHVLKNHLRLDIDVEQLGNIIFNETRSLSGENVQEARENAAHTLINAREKWGASVNTYAKPASSKVTDAAKKEDSQQYNDSQTAAINAVLNHAMGRDPTGGAEHFNFRPNSSTGKFYDANIRTQVGPLNNSYPTPGLPAHGIYANTYKAP